MIKYKILKREKGEYEYLIIRNISYEKKMEEIDLKELLTLFWNKKTQIVLIVLIFMLLGIIYTMGFIKPKYTSSTTLLLANGNSTNKTNTITTSDITLNSKLVSTYSKLVQSKSVMRQVIANLDVNIDEEELKKQVSVTQEEDTEIIKISVENENPTIAANIANEVARVFSDKVKEIYNINNIQIIDEAEINPEPSNIHHTKDILIFMFIGIVISIGYVLLANMLDTTIKTAEEVEKQFKVPVLATIPLYNFEPIKTKGGKKRK